MKKGWINGPKELLDHASEHIITKSDFDKRIAFISIDNAFELSIVTFLSLPRRILNRIGPSKKELTEVSNSFSDYLNLLEKYAVDLISEIDLEDIEWYHRTRNQLYHNGNCITVDLSQVEAYYEIAKSLYFALFNEAYKYKFVIDQKTNLGVFLSKWMQFNNLLRSKLPPKGDNLAYHWKRDFLSSLNPVLVEDYNFIFNMRNDLEHNDIANENQSDFDEAFSRFDRLISYLLLFENKEN